MQTPGSALQRTKEALLQRGPGLAMLYATTILALVTLRVQNQGLVGKLYSSRPIPVFFFEKEALNAGGRAYIKRQQKLKGKERGLGTWAGLRASEGLPVDAVNLTHSGRMMRSLLVEQVAPQGAMFFARIVAADREGAKKVGYNLDRYGNWLLPTPGEEAQAREAVRREVIRIVTTTLQA